MEEPLTRSLLGGLRVVEVAGRYSGRFAASLLEALGASVTPVETVAALTAGLLAGTDVLITSGDNGEAGADPDPALRRRGGLDFAGVHVDVSPYGSTGACRAWKGD
ncbi:MAG TPA: hypothetical protein VHL53_21600, partial [Acidimicrobiia bacterium]|nr:hypothetical protein [Acidimicrobiia bacterium]